jgi:glycosyltransferase involved in cell wall biosynthesis
MWPITGHCAHSFDCERWKNGCGQCPDLTSSPAINRDAAACNWQRKGSIYAKSRLYVVTASRWLMNKIEQSILVPAIIEGRVIPNGVDTSIFSPVDKRAVRAVLGLSQEAKLLLFAANGIRGNRWKDYRTMRVAAALIAERLYGQKILFIALGEDAPAEQIGQAEVRFVPYQQDPKSVGRYYQAADVYIHAAKADTFPTTILEALACGTPVVATAAGGIPEQVKGLAISDFEYRISNLNKYGTSVATGVLVTKGDATGMAMCIERLLSDELLLRQLGENAAQDAGQRFALNQQVDAYLEWYQEILERQNVNPSGFEPNKCVVQQ